MKGIKLDKNPTSRYSDLMKKQEISNAAKALRAIPSKKRSDASRQNGLLGGRPKKVQAKSKKD